MHSLKKCIAVLVVFSWWLVSTYEATGTGYFVFWERIVINSWILWSVVDHYFYKGEKE